MDVIKFLKYLYKRKYVLIIVPIITVIITYFLGKNILDNYVSEAQISTGFVDESQQVLQEKETYVQESRITQRFNNLIEIMKLKLITDQISYKLMLHDLTNKKPFRNSSQLLKELNPSARKHAIEVYTQKYNKMEPLSLWDKDQRGLYQVLVSMKYDEESLNKKLRIFRNQDSDFITVSFESENPELSAFVVNAICQEFIKYYSFTSKDNENKGVAYLSSLLAQKRQALDEKMSQLRDYKIKNNVINLYEQSKILYGEIMDFESKKLETQKSIDSYSQTLQNIDNKFNPTERKYLESTLSKINRDIVSTKEKIKAVTEKYVQSSFSPVYSKSLDSLNNILTDQINDASDKYIISPLNTKEKLITEKLTLEVTGDLAKYSLATIENHLNNLNQKFKTLVPFDAVVQTLERDIEVASTEYLDVLNKYNQVNMQANSNTKLRQIQLAMPGLPQPSKKMLLVILSGIISFIFCTLVFFILFVLDRSIKSVEALENATEIPVIGELSYLKSFTDLKDIWLNKTPDEDTLNFKNLLRAIRFEVKTKMLYNNNKVLAVTSMVPNEGKTFFSLSLAYSFAMLNKKVLLIDGDFDKPDISEASNHKTYIEDYVNDRVLPDDNAITIIGNKGGDSSLLEVVEESVIESIFEDFKKRFDVIIIDTCSLKSLNKAKEWIMYADKNISVFEFGKQVHSHYNKDLNYLTSLDDKYIGWILNKVKEESRF
jgi:Mrp family chromosome partitioning ATPase/uncharacterized protein involved in exopolysaccharide biosynthesis